MKKLQLGLILGVLTVSALAYAAPTPIPDTGAQFEMPADWKTAGQGKNTATIVDPSGSAAVSFAVIPGKPEVLKKADAALKKQLAAILSKMKVEEKMKAQKVNGLDATVGTASGVMKAGNKPVKMAVMYVVTPSKKVLFVFAILETAHFDEMKGKVLGIMTSIAPAAK
jgi:hypothetical protein